MVFPSTLVLSENKNGDFAKCPVCHKTVKVKISANRLEIHYASKRSFCSAVKLRFEFVKPISTEHETRVRERDQQKTIHKFRRAGEGTGVIPLPSLPANSKKSEEERELESRKKFDKETQRIREIERLKRLIAEEEAAEKEKKKEERLRKRRIKELSQPSEKPKKKRTKSNRRARDPENTRSGQDWFAINSEDSWGRDYLGNEGGSNSVRAQGGGSMESNRSRH